MNIRSHVERAGLQVGAELAAFVEQEALVGIGVEAESFWRGTAELFARFIEDNRSLLAERNRLQAEIDRWHTEHPGTVDGQAYTAFLREIGYLVETPAPFAIDTDGVDAEIATVAGPQLVVPVLNARFLLNAANARWGSLYDALYGTDAVAPPPAGDAPYDPQRGGTVVARAKAFLDEALPLRDGRWADLRSMDGGIALRDPAQFVGRAGHNLLFRHRGLHIELRFDGDHPVGRDDPIHLADVILESALTTIVDFEDSVAAVDAEDKVAAYRNWLGLMRDDLTADVTKGDHTFTRRLADDRRYVADDGSTLSLPGRALLLARTVGHLMTTPALRLPDGSEAPEGILDGILCTLIALHDLRRTGTRNSRTGAIYLVKPKMHGPAEVAFADRLFEAIEDLLGLPRHTIKIGVMDEERRTSANLAACIHAVRHRLFFINTGFLDRTGDELHSSMRAGPMLRKGAMKATPWIQAYEDRNVQIGLACGLAGRAQIGKGMWAMPDRMGDMLAQKSAHPQAGASTAWVPSPTAATLHALHYHAVDVADRQRARAAEPVAPLEALLTIPLAAGHNWSPDEIRDELDNNVQGILGYVSRWIDQGVGCSKVPDIHDIGLMEDRATLRISSQHLANWLLHGVCTRDEVDAAFARMATKVDAQNAGDPAYRPMAGDPDSLAFQAARALVYQGIDQPNGYTEPLLHAYRRRFKDQGE